MTILLLDKDNRNTPNAIIETDLLTAKEVQDIIYEMKSEYEGCYDSEILTDLLIEKGCSICWIGGDEEVYW